jgi:hypothetical protein
MEITDATFDLRASDIVHLRQQGISNGLISAMQERHTKLRKSETGLLGGNTVGAGLFTVVEILPKNPAVNQISINDIVQASRSFVSDDIIIRQIASTKSVFDLTQQQFRSMEEQGVSQRVINYMRYRQPQSFSSYPSPYGPPPMPSLPFGTGTGMFR